MPDSSENTDFNFPDLKAVSAEILTSRYREVDMLTAHKTLDGAGETLLVRGDVAEGGGVSKARAVVIDGNVEGSADAPCRIASDGPVVIMGAVRFAHVHGQSIYLGKGVRECHLVAEVVVYVEGDLIDSDAQLGGGVRLTREIEAYRAELGRTFETREQLLRQIRHEKSRLNSLLHATGIVFNLNIGQIARQSEEGLRINLMPFYKALSGRSDAEIDLALKEFFAKAVLGMLTRLNQHYIAEGPGHRQRFAAVVRKLRDLVFITRSYDKCGIGIQMREALLQDRLIAARAHRNAVYVAGGVLPEFRARFFQILCDRESLSFDSCRLRTLALALRPGKIRDREEIVLWRDGEAIDLVFVSADALSRVALYPAEERVTWAPLTGG